MHSVAYYIPNLILLIAVIIAGDRIQFNSREITGLFDTFLHGVISLLILLPLCLRFYDYMIAFGTSFILDIDHMVCAKSLKIKDALNLPARPVTHSITFATLISIIIWLLLPVPFRIYLPIVVFISLTSHILRDSAEGKTFILWPFRINRLAYPLYIALEIILFVLAVIISPIRTAGVV